MNALQQVQPAKLVPSAFSHTRYTIKRPWLTFLGRKFYVYGPDGQVVLFVRHKMMTLKDEWNVFSDDTERVPLLKVKARQAIALDIVTDIFDVASGQNLGAVRNKGLKSIIRDTWECLDATDVVVGKFAEDSSSLLRRFIPLLLGRWHLEMNGAPVARLDQVFRFFSKEFSLVVSGPPGKADTRFIIGCALLALMREISREQQS